MASHSWARARNVGISASARWMISASSTGGLGGTIRTGRHVKFDKVPVANLWLALAHAAGVETDQFADSTGVTSEVFDEEPSAVIYYKPNLTESTGNDQR